MAKETKEIEFGQVPFELICRFIELSKNEIMVISLLYAHRNTKSLQCNPGRKLLCQESKLLKSHLSRTLKNLEEKGWILEQENGEFILLESYQIGNRKVTKLATKKLPNSQLKVTNSATESSQTGNWLNKDLNIKGTEKEHIYSANAENPKPPNAHKPTLTTGFNSEETLLPPTPPDLSPYWKILECSNISIPPTLYPVWERTFMYLADKEINPSQLGECITWLRGESWVNSITPQLVEGKIHGFLEKQNPEQKKWAFDFEPITPPKKWSFNF